MKPGLISSLGLALLVVAAGMMVLATRSRTDLRLPSTATHVHGALLRRCITIKSASAEHRQTIDLLLLLDTVPLSGRGLEGWWRARYSVDSGRDGSFQAGWRWVDPDSVDVRVPNWPVSFTVRFPRSDRSVIGRGVWQDDAGGAFGSEASVAPAACVLPPAHSME